MKTRNVLITLAAVAMFLVSAPVAYGADDCCWDWDPKNAGKSDAGQGEPYKEDTVWAVCVKAPTKGASGTPQDSPCFQRDGRQMVWQGWECLKDPKLPAPDGSIPPPPEGTTGYFCFNKENPGEQEAQLKSGSGTVPLVAVSEGPIVIPTVSEWGLIVLTLLGMAVGTIMIARKRRTTAA